MPVVHIRDGGVWKPVKRIWVRSAGVWKPLVRGYVRNGGVSRQFYPDTVTSTTYSTPGTYSYTVPAGITQLTVSYITTTGTTSSTVSVTPLSTVSVTIGDYGSGSSFGALSAPAYSSTVTTWSGNVDQAPGIYVMQQVATSTALSYSGTGTQGVLEPGASAAGIFYDETSEGNQGDFEATVSLNTVPISTLVNPYRIAITSFSGRGSYTLTQQPSAGNTYRYQIAISDPAASNAAYSYTATLQQIVALTITQ